MPYLSNVYSYVFAAVCGSVLEMVEAYVVLNDEAATAFGKPTLGFYQSKGTTHTTSTDTAHSIDTEHKDKYHAPASVLSLSHGVPRLGIS